MPVKPVKAPVRAKRARADVEKEFTEIQQEVETAREAPDAKAEEAARLREAEVRGAVEGVTGHRPADLRPRPGGRPGAIRCFGQAERRDPTVGVRPRGRCAGT
jgi:hypothetical protein